MDTTLLKGLAVLEVLAARETPAGVSEIAGLLGIGKSNTHRLLQTLVAAGYVRRDADRRYACSLRLWEKGWDVARRYDVARVARAPMVALAQDTAETVNLSVLDGDEVVYLDKIDSPLPVRADTRIAGRAPAYCTATGKALLAHVEDPAALLARVTWERFTARTPRDAATVLSELSEVRRRGYALSRGEWRDGVAGVAAPILGAGGRSLAAVGVGGPAERMPPARLRRLAPMVVAAAAAITRAAGMGGPTLARSAP
ncbi:MAG: IclR family transcriptional regulator [Burkholderiales bacterium]|nr:IclR family transcriptional regulator [Burkholderiales bacterium]